MAEHSQLQFIWKQVSEQLQKLISPISYDAYIKTLEPIDIAGRLLVLKAETVLGANTIMKKHADKIRDAIAKCDLGIKDFRLVVDGSEEYPLEYEADEDFFQESPINKNFTFDSFVTGSGSKLVYAAAKAVAEAPGETFNPLFIYGESGLGKTHMMHAIANEIARKYPEKKVLYTTCENFLNEFINSIAQRSSARFRFHYRNVDVLMIDDIQFLKNKTQVQEEFFHTFNELYGANKQIVLSADCEPKEIELLDERLRTRFEGGLKAQVLPPDIETKIAIVQKKAELKKQLVSLDVATYIAENSDDNVRSLEGLLNKVLFSALLHEQPPTLEIAMEALKFAPQNDLKETLTTSHIIETVCHYYKIKKSDLISKKRNKELVEPRQICAYLMTELMSIPLVTIGQALGGKNYATIIHSRDKVSELIRISDTFATEVNDIKNLILKK